MKKPRHTCEFCKAKKYARFMTKKFRKGVNGFPYWECKNEDKCVKRSANYRK